MKNILSGSTFSGIALMILMLILAYRKYVHVLRTFLKNKTTSKEVFVRRIQKDYIRAKKKGDKPAEFNLLRQYYSYYARADA